MLHTCLHLITGRYRTMPINPVGLAQSAGLLGSSIYIVTLFTVMVLVITHVLDQINLPLVYYIQFLNPRAAIPQHGLLPMLTSIVSLPTAHAFTLPATFDSTIKAHTSDFQNRLLCWLHRYITINCEKSKRSSPLGESA